MKRIILITALIVGLTAAYGFAQMGGGQMRSGQGMMGSGQGMMEQGYMGDRGQQQTYGNSYYPCQQMMGSGMMRSGMMGSGMMGPGMMGPGMMGPGMMGSGMMGSGMMGGYGSRGYNSKAYEKHQKDYQNYMDDTAGLRKKLHNKKFEYYEAFRNPDSDRKSIMKLEKEMRDIQWEIYEKFPR